MLLVFTVLLVAPEIHDEGKFFSPDAIKQANDIIREISRQSGRDLLIETFPSVPADQADKVKAMSTDERTKFFRQWAEERARQAVVNGVYILVTKEPRHLEVLYTEKARDAFGQEAYEKLRAELLKDFRAQQYDGGLLAAAKFVQERFAKSK
jgi:hypothetical protein